MSSKTKSNVNDLEKAQRNQTVEKTTCCECFIAIFSYVLITATLPVSIWFCLRLIRQYEQGVVFRFGKLLKSGTIGPGIAFIIPFVDSLHIVDLRMMTFNTSSLKILTKDAVTVQVNAIVCYRIIDSIDAVCKVSNFEESTKNMALAAIKVVVASRNYDELDAILDYHTVSEDVSCNLNKMSNYWGINIEHVDVICVGLSYEYISREYCSYARSGQYKSNPTVPSKIPLISEVSQRHYHHCSKCCQCTCNQRKEKSINDENLDNLIDNY